jgi:hypothetical protein
MVDENKLDLVDRKVLETAVLNASYWDNQDEDVCWQLVQDAPSVEAVKVIHGKWLYYSTTMMECSICKRHTARHRFAFCPHCGAQMEDCYYV